MCAAAILTLILVIPAAAAAQTRPVPPPAADPFTWLEDVDGTRAMSWVEKQNERTARELLGANGIMDDYPVMRHMCNLETVFTYEGTHDVHTLVVGQTLTGLNAF